MKTQETVQSIQANILAARTVDGVTPDRHQVPYHSFAHLLQQRAAENPSGTFLVTYDDESGARREYSYSEFNRRVNQVANLLQNEYGVKRGERVATVTFNHPDTVFAYFACWKLGATVTPQNASEDDARIGFILRNAECRIALVRSEYLQRVKDIQREIPGLRELLVLDDGGYQTRLDSQPVEFAAPAANMLDDECLLVYTSGTTGAPKGVQLCQYNLLVDARGMVDWQRIGPETRMMCILPIHHVNGIVVTLVTPLYAGSSVVLLRAFKASTFWRRVAFERVQIVSLVPTILQFLCEANEDIGQFDLAAMRHVICGAGTLAVALAARFEERFGIRVLHGYGLSETTCYSSKLPVDLSTEEHRHWLRDFGYPSIGVPFWPNAMAIHDPQGNPLPAGEKGEIVVRGHNVMLGYFQRPDANLDAFTHGWFRTGDEGFFYSDARGRQFFFISGRLKELINRGGVKYSPFEIEEVLLQLSGVKVGLAVAFDNDWYGEEVGAYVVKEEGCELTAEAVLEHCRSQMPYSKAPKVVVFGTDIPLTTTGKYQRLKLKDLFAEYRSTQFKEGR